MKSLVQLVFTLLLSLTVGRKVHLHLSIQDDLDSAANGEENIIILFCFGLILVDISLTIFI